MRMFNPPHPGKVVKEYLGDMTVTEAAARIGVSRVTLQRVVGGSAGISPDMAYRLGQLFGTSPDMWYGMQVDYDMDAAEKIERPPIERITSGARTAPAAP
jgi:addiction module HigA family antidote